MALKPFPSGTRTFARAWDVCSPFLTFVPGCPRRSDLNRRFLPSWNDGPAKQAIVDFVKATTDKSSPEGRLGRDQHEERLEAHFLIRKRSLSMTDPNWIILGRLGRHNKIYCCQNDALARPMR